MSTADEPRTEAGRDFLYDYEAFGPPSVRQFTDGILAIEAEARQTEPRLDALRSHAFPHCEVCGTAVDDPEAMETCAGFAYEAAAGEEGEKP